MTQQRIAIIGLGLIGGSIANALRRTGWYVRGFDRSDSVAHIAEDRGLVDSAAGTLIDALQGASMVVLAMPVQTILASLEAVDEHSEHDATILDTGSVKTPIVAAMSALPGSHRALGGHPIAGNERSGPAAAHPDLFRRRPFALCPSSATHESAITQAKLLVRALRAIPHIVPPEEHDHALAHTSHLPQLLSSALALCVEPEDGELAGPALEDMTRLASSPPDLWRDIFAANREYVAQAVRSYSGHLQALAELIEIGNVDELAATMTRAAERVALLRERIP